VSTRSAALKRATRDDLVTAFGIAVILAGLLILVIGFALDDLIWSGIGIVLVIVGAIPLVKRLTRKEKNQ
jgi:uncharacterized membrane protein HdeD (DUF308 family)